MSQVSAIAWATIVNQMNNSENSSDDNEKVVEEVFNENK